MTDWSTIEAELKRRPMVGEEEIGRVMDRVHAAEAEDAGLGRTAAAPRRASHRWWGFRPATLTVRPLLAAAAGIIVIVGAYVAGASRSPRDRVGVNERARGSRTASPADAPRAVQFVFSAPGAQQVSLAGDFNDWSRTATPMARAGTDGVWSVVVPLTPGRHVYSFIVDGKRWLPDSLAPRAADSEFGTANSVVLVEQSS